MTSCAGLRAWPRAGTALLALAAALCAGGSGCRSSRAPFPEQALPPPDAAVLVGAGDIADCNGSDDDATGALVQGLLERRPSARVFTTGDNAYPAGTLEEFERCYRPAWGAFLDRTFATPGNHDWMTPNAAGFRATFKLPAEGPLYRAADFGGWRILMLDTDCQASDTCTAGSPQLAWLARELEANRGRCTLVLGHHPRFSSGPHGSSDAHQPLWDVLAAGGADLVLWGHDHIYERFAPLDAAGRPDPAGVRAITVGTGGRSPYGLRPEPAAGSEVRRAGQAGVLVVTLLPAGYAFSFVTVDGAVADQGTGACASRP